MAALGKIWGCDPSTIKNIMKAYGVSGRTLSEARRNYLNYTINEDSFSKIDSPDKAYWLGVMYSDGYVSKTKYTNKFGISVAERDKKWLEKFKQFLNYNGEIKEYETGKTSFVVDGGHLVAEEVFLFSRKRNTYTTVCKIVNW